LWRGLGGAVVNSFCEGWECRLGSLLNVCYFGREWHFIGRMKLVIEQRMIYSLRA
jgi:hypothetical protein